MCNTCGCDQPDNKTKYTIPGHDHEHGQGEGQARDPQQAGGRAHAHTHHHEQDHSHSKVVQLEQDVLAKNNLKAERNRGYFDAKNILAINMVSSPGSGKTTLLEKIITDLKPEMSFFVIEGDQQSLNDARRIDATGTPVLQINTGSGCHLDAEMVDKAVKQLRVADGAVLVIENVGNLVCPAMFDLGEACRIVIISVTEGEDKPLKYPGMFHSSDVCVINKTDLLPHVDFDVEKAREYAMQVNHHLRFFEVSAKTGEGMDAFYIWLKGLVKSR